MCLLQNDVEAVCRFDKANIFHDIVMLLAGQHFRRRPGSRVRSRSGWQPITHMEVLQQIDFCLPTPSASCLAHTTCRFRSPRSCAIRSWARPPV